ncbi:3'-5' exonuclease [Paeniroseomonas aquatica]
MLERIQQALSTAGVPAAIAQRRDDFRSPEFLWLSAVLRQTLRPLDTRALEALIGAFNRWWGTELQVGDIIAAAEVSNRSYLDEWAAAVPPQIDAAGLKLAELTAKYGKEPSRFRHFIDAVIQDLPTGDESLVDLAEDRNAWNDLNRNISRAIGRDAPLEQFLQELSIRSKEPPPVKSMVALMTIHAAKGKEFDHVFLAGMAESILPSFHSVKLGENSPEMEEERRNCFVAITRAKEWLCLSYADTYGNWGKMPSRFLTEMGFELPQTYSD